MNLFETPLGTKVTDFGEINLDLTLDCGQCFRWRKTESGTWCGTAFGKSTKVRKIDDGLLFEGTPQNDVCEIWADYFDLKRDYSKYLTELKRDETVRDAVNEYGTIRILHQEPWEAMCSFIISACNNIPRIKQIIERFCNKYGEPIPNGEHAFPTPAVTADLTEDDLRRLGTGFRAPSIVAAAQAVVSDSEIFNRLRNESESDARRELMNFRGIGKKVADCVMLFSLGFDNVFPTDTHVRAAVAELYPNGLPECFGIFGGLAQQYVFHSHRMNAISTSSKEKTLKKQ